MPNRYDNRSIFRNDHESYENLLEERGVSFIRQYGTPRMSYPTIDDISSFSTAQHIWKVGDKFYKLAIQYYTDPQYWWVIALYNQAPTEASFRVGDLVEIPMPLERVLRTLKGG